MSEVAGKISPPAPYYEEDGITLYHGDFRQCVSLQADAVIADPPYGETSLEWDHWPDAWPSAVLPFIKPAASMWCFGSFRMFLDRRDDFAAWKISHEIIWEKHNGSGFFTDRFRRVHELAAHFYPASSRWAEVFKAAQYTMDATARVVRKKEKPSQWHGRTGSTTYVSEDGGPRLMNSVIRIRSCHGHAQNETQKPIELLKPLIEYACPPGGLLFVPFAGAGSDLVAAKELGRRAVGCEIREEQCEIAANRLRQGVLFGATA